MSKAVLIFKLPEEQVEHKMAMNGGAYHAALWDFSQYLRTQLKYNDSMSEVERETLEKVRTEFYSTIGDLLND